MVSEFKPLPQVLEEVEQLGDWLTHKLKVNPIIVQQKMIDTISGLFPEYGSMLTSAKQEVAHSAPLENIDLTPTQIATKLSQQTGKIISNQQVNQLLADQGLQEKLETSRGKWEWQLTEKGKDFGNVYLATGANSDWSGNQIKWSEKVVELLKPNLSR